MTTAATFTEAQAQAAIDAAFPRVNAGIRRFWLGTLLQEHKQRGTTAEEFIETLKSKRKESAQKEKILREALRKKYGAGNYKITASNEVHAYGRAPNSAETRWFFVGADYEVLRDIENGGFNG